MADDRHLCQIQRVEQTDQVANGVKGGVEQRVRGSRTAAVAAHVEGDGAVARRSERLHLQAPAAP